LEICEPLRQKQGTPSDNDAENHEDRLKQQGKSVKLAAEAMRGRENIFRSEAL
jgi:hypothetical protein